MIHTVAYSQLDSTFQEIEEVTISSVKEKKIVFEDSKYYIIDFTISDAQALILLRNFRNYYLYELDQDMNYSRKLQLKVDASSLYEDCFGNTHLVTNDSIYSIVSDSLGLFLAEAYPKMDFMYAMMDCVGATSEKIVFEHLAYYNQFQKFYTVDMNSGDKKVIYEINDTLLAKSLHDAAIVMQTDDYFSNHVRMGDINANKEASKDMRTINGNQDRADFFVSHVTRPAYNPMFVVDDTLYFFNHSEGRLDQLDDRGNALSSTNIDYHKNKDWQNLVYSDEAQKKFYVVSIENGVQTLIRLPLSEGEQETHSKITKHAYPKKVIVRNGYAYYTYKPSFDSNLNKLYRQKL